MSVSPLKQRVPLELEPLADLDKGDMSETIWKELQGTIEYEAKSVQATGVIIPSPARNRGTSRSLSPGGNNNNQSPSSSSADNNTNSSQQQGGDPAAMPKMPQIGRFPAMEKFFQALATLGVTKSQYRGLAMLHNSAQLGVWQSHMGGTNAQMRAQLHERVAAQSEAIDDSLRQASDRARVLREEQARELAKPGDDEYLKQLQANRIDAEFERMRDQLRVEDAARREQLEYAREEKRKQAAEEDLQARKNKMKEERERRHREREEKLREIQAQEEVALGKFETALREHAKAGTSPAAKAALAGS